MSGKIVLTVTSPVPANQASTMLVQVSGATAGSELTIVLAQEAGPQPFTGTNTQTVRADSDGTASLAFQVALAGPGSATMQATASDARGTYYEPDAESVDVEDVGAEVVA